MSSACCSRAHFEDIVLNAQATRRRIAARRQPVPSTYASICLMRALCDDHKVTESPQDALWV